MKHLISLAALLSLLTAPLSAADDYSFAFEGSAEKRERLSHLQSASELPELKLKEWINSTPYTLEDLKGKVVVLDFWATWCGPCIGSIPKNNKLAKKYKDDLVIIGICAQNGSEKMQSVVEQYGIEYPVAIDRDDQTNEAYEANGYPDYYIIDQTGKLVVADCKNSKVPAVLERLLSDDE